MHKWFPGKNAPAAGMQPEGGDAPKTGTNGEQEKKALLLGKCLEWAEKSCPLVFSEGKSKGIHGNYPGRDYQAWLILEPDGRESTVCRLKTLIQRNGSDLCIQHYIFRGTQEAMETYLSDSSNIPEMLESWQQLSDAMDRRD